MTIDDLLQEHEHYLNAMMRQSLLTNQTLLQVGGPRSSWLCVKQHACASERGA